MDHLLLRLGRRVAIQPPFELVDAGEQLAGEHRAGVVEAQVAAQAHRSPEQGHR